MAKEPSKRYKLSWYDAVKGVIMAFLTVFLTSAYGLVESGHFPLCWADWKPIVLASTTATLAYIIKQYFTGKK